MIRCEKCGKPISKIITNEFQYDGSDRDVKYPLISTDQNAVFFDADENLCCYGLDEEEQIEHISCPHCGEFPFKSKEVQMYNIVRVVMFKEVKADVE